jgi:peptidoglycan/LPS O-acetylase OafA/YrhL
MIDSAMPPREKVTTYDIMNGMRALAAFEVLVGHVRDLLFVDFRSGMSWPLQMFYLATGFGYQAVIVFFVLSGFWIGHLVITRDDTSRWSWSWYAFDRLTRLWVVLLPALLAGAVLDLLGRYGLKAPIYLGIQGAHSTISDIAASLTPLTLLGNILFLQTLWVSPFGSNGPLWSLANEFWYYVWFPIIFLFVKHRKFSWWSAAAIILSMGLFSKLLPGFFYWLCGVGTYLLVRSEYVPKMGKTAAIISAVSLGICFAGLLLISRYAHAEAFLIDFPLSLTFSFILAVLLSQKFEYPDFLKPICIFGARSSFSLYVFHYPLVMLAAALFVPEERREPSLYLFMFFCATVIGGLAYSIAWSTLTEGNTKAVRRFLLAQPLFSVFR